MVYEYDFVTWDNYYGQLCKAYDKHDFAKIAEVVRELKKRYDTKVKHLADDIKSGIKIHKELHQHINKLVKLIPDGINIPSLN